MYLNFSSRGGDGAGGAVRIIWPGTIRQFPSTTGTGEIIMSGIQQFLFTHGTQTSETFEALPTAWSND